MNKIREKYYDCSSAEDSSAKIVEEYVSVGGSYRYTAYFNKYDRCVNCFKKWVNYLGININVTIYLKIDDDWVGVAYKHITKDNIDDTEDHLKGLSDICGRNINNIDML